MLIRKVRIRNIRAIADLEWQLGASGGPGWHVVLGDNGSGKTSFLRAIALGLIGDQEAAAARQDWNSWLRVDADEGSVEIEIASEPGYDVHPVTGSTKRVEFPIRIGLERKTPPSSVSSEIQPGRFVEFKGAVGTFLFHQKQPSSGWFSAAYGPFRRFSGGNQESERIFRSNPGLGAHISLFSEGFALTEIVTWLQELHYKSLENRLEEKLFLAMLTQFVNQDGFLPHRVRLHDVSSEGVIFRDFNGFKVAIDDLGDGYRSLLSMTFELLRQLVRAFPQKMIFDESHRKVLVPGVVLIDEIDAHLHPTWQKRIGFCLTEYFPKMQFIVTTHSPLICHAAVHGSIFRFPTPGSREGGYLLEGIERDRLIYGDILDAFSTEAFGGGDTRSRQSHDKLDRLASLNVRESASGLTEPEKKEQEQLRAVFHTSPDVRK